MILSHTLNLPVITFKLFVIVTQWMHHYVIKFISWEIILLEYFNAIMRRYFAGNYSLKFYFVFSKSSNQFSREAFKNSNKSNFKQRSNFPLVIQSLSE